MSEINRNAVVFPKDKLRKENARMKESLREIARTDYWPEKEVQLYRLQECIHRAEEALEDIDD